MLYLDSTIFPDLRVLRHRPALRSWNTTTMKKRIKMETETRCLGKLEHHGEFDPEEEQDGMNVYNGLDVYVPPINDKEPETKEEYYEKTVLKFDIIFDERSELVRTLRNGVKKFEGDQMMIDFCKQYGELFNDNEFNLYESSKDDDNEGEPDGDNENNNHDDDGAPTADANKEKRNGSEGTEENGSEATEGESDGKEENMNGDEREVTVQMDVNNQNKELNKEKDANETEDNDKMNNNDMKNDSVQEKQDTDKDENAKVDNVKEKQGDDKDEIGEDEFCYTQFTDSQCEEMENQAKEEIKKKKTSKRVITKDMFKWKKEDGKKYDEVKQYKAFSDMMKNEFKKDDELKKLKDLEMAFFSIIAHEHYYLIVFNFLKGTTVIIGNSKTLMTYEEKYKEVCDVLMGMRFAAKTLTHEINIHREEICKQALEFEDRITDKNLKKQMIKEAIKAKKEKQFSFLK
ncbi:hypothetical protein Tco_1409696 [Tanacetum coccineum]